MSEPTPSVTSGWPWPLGCTLIRQEGQIGVNVAVFSAHATAIELCLFDVSGTVEAARLRLPGRTDEVFHGFVPGLAPGQVYGLRAHGAWAPEQGHRFNPAKLLIDPYARAFMGELRHEGPNLVDPERPFDLDPRDTAALVPKCVLADVPSVVETARLNIPWDRSFIYEAHVKGMTARHPAVPPAQRGRYAGMAHPAVLDHLRRLGVTAVELLPIMEYAHERRLVQAGLINHWGYNSYGFMAPARRYAEHDPLAEFAAMVAAFHGAGIEVILDVVYNHTAESDEFGPIFAFKGLDNVSYYRLPADSPAHYVNDTGCGNTLDTAQPRVMQLVMDSLRSFAAMGVDGFRFDLAPVMGRTREGAFDRDAALLQAIRQDPVLGGLKLIAEPWDLGMDGFRLGQFPPPFAEWNSSFKDTVRRFWRGDEAVLPDLAHVLLGSERLFGWSGRAATASLNYVTSHDGFTMADLVAYADKHNEANGEGNRDGDAHNLSVNHGREGPSDDPAVRDARRRHVKALLATLLLAQGTPMLAMGDEQGRTQDGNNNAYCQDTPISWNDWPAPGEPEPELVAFIARLARLRQTHPALTASTFRHGTPVIQGGLPDVTWLRPDGRTMSEADWQDPAGRALVLRLVELQADHPERILHLIVNAGPAPVAVTLEPPAASLRWLVDSAASSPAADRTTTDITVAAGSLVLLEDQRHQDG